MLDELCAAGLQPNLRTFNTLLRGCMRNANGVAAVALWARALEAKIKMDSSSLEYYIKALSWDQQVDTAWSVANEMSALIAVPPLAWTALALATAMGGDEKSEFYERVCGMPLLFYT